MSIFSKSADEAYKDYCRDRGMFGRMDKEEFDRKRATAHEIATGFSSGLLERDEEVWEMVKEIKEEKGL